jgi:hypothetical protein
MAMPHPAPPSDHIFAMVPHHAYRGNITEHEVACGGQWFDVADEAQPLLAAAAARANHGVSADAGTPGGRVVAAAGGNSRQHCGVSERLASTGGGSTITHEPAPSTGEEVVVVKGKHATFSYNVTTMTCVKLLLNGDPNPKESVRPMRTVVRRARRAATSQPESGTSAGAAGGFKDVAQVGANTPTEVGACEPTEGETRASGNGPGEATRLETRVWQMRVPIGPIGTWEAVPQKSRFLLYGATMALAYSQIFEESPGR